MTSATGEPLLKARLGPSHQVHPAALDTLLDAVALWQGQRVRAVLAVDVRAPFYGQCPGLSTEEHVQTLRYQLDVVPVGLVRPRRALDGLGSFRQLQLVLDQAVPR
jgi:hypothetical protein